MLVEVAREAEEEGEGGAVGAETEGGGGGGGGGAPFRAWLVAPLADVAAAVGPGSGGAVTAPRDPTATSTAVPLPLEKTRGRAGDEGASLLVLRPSARATFFETPQPFNLVAFLKTPYGMLIGFVIFAMFALPRMKIDPEEYEELLGGGGGGGADNNNAGAAPSPPIQRQPPGGAAGGGSSPPSGLRQRRG